MALNGAGTRFISSFTIATGNPGGTQVVTVAIQPLGSYPALGEPISALFALLGGKVKVAAGVAPDNAVIEGQQSAGYWTYDPATATLRYWTSLVPAEHATGVYSAGELAASMRITFFFPLYGSMSR